MDLIYNSFDKQKMSAIKNFFNHAREIEQRRKEWESKYNVEIEEFEPIPDVVYNCEKEVLECDTLLRRDWFIDDEDVLELIKDLSDPAFFKILERLDTYSSRIQTVLYDFRSKTYMDKFKLKIRNIDDDELYNRFIEREIQLNKKLDSLWEQYKLDHGLNRPDGELDDNYNELYNKLKEVKKKLEEEKNKPVAPVKQSYVPPSMRDKVQPKKPTISIEVEKLQNEVARIENEIRKVKNQIEEEEHKWNNDRKEYHHRELWQKMR